MIGGVIFCIGDSLTNGARDPYGLSYANLLGRMLSEKFGQSWVGVADGINGETSGGLVRRFYKTVKSFPEASEVLCWIGTNDAKDNVNTPLDVYRANIRDIITAMKIVGKPLFLGMLPHKKGFGAPDYICNKRIDAYNEVLIELVKEYAPRQRLYLVELRDLPEEFKCDGVHLTHEGNQWVANRFLAAILLVR